MTEEIEKYKKALGIALDALATYADPETYHAIAIIADRPAGTFADDFSKTKNPFYDRKMPGKLARATFKKLKKLYPDLTYYSKNQ